MIVEYADLWDEHWDLRCITTNGFVKQNGCCVMGRGVAQQAKSRYRGIALKLGQRIRKFGNRVFYFPEWSLATFPVKHNWWEKADTVLIHDSAYQLKEFVNTAGFTNVALPRPGCGNGGLEWPEVEGVLINILDDRFHVIDKEHHGKAKNHSD